MQTGDGVSEAQGARLSSLGLPLTKVSTPRSTQEPFGQDPQPASWRSGSLSKVAFGASFVLCP